MFPRDREIYGAEARVCVRERQRGIKGNKDEARFKKF